LYNKLEIHDYNKNDTIELYKCAELIEEELTKTDYNNIALKKNDIE